MLLVHNNYNYYNYAINRCCRITQYYVTKLNILLIVIITHLSFSISIYALHNQTTNHFFTNTFSSSFISALSCLHTLCCHTSLVCKKSVHITLRCLHVFVQLFCPSIVNVWLQDYYKPIYNYSLVYAQSSSHVKN